MRLLLLVAVLVMGVLECESIPRGGGGNTIDDFGSAFHMVHLDETDELSKVPLPLYKQKIKCQLENLLVVDPVVHEKTKSKIKFEEDDNTCSVWGNGKNDNGEEKYGFMTFDNNGFTIKPKIGSTPFPCVAGSELGCKVCTETYKAKMAKKNKTPHPCPGYCTATNGYLCNCAELGKNCEQICCERWGKLYPDRKKVVL
jgi:hypothetical protein